MRPSGIEPEAIAWEAMILPLNQERPGCQKKYRYVYHNWRKSVLENIPTTYPPHFHEYSLGKIEELILPFHERNEE